MAIFTEVGHGKCKAEGIHVCPVIHYATPMAENATYLYAPRIYSRSILPALGSVKSFLFENGYFFQRLECQLNNISSFIIG
jgi:hypothetical protein